MFLRILAEEKFWLERRLELIQKVDKITQDYFDNDRDIEEIDNDYRINFLRCEYKNVETPYALEKKLRSIYSNEHYGDVLSKKSKKKN